MTEFIPKGFVGLPKAVWYMATRRNPNLWKAALIDAREGAIWLHCVIEDNDAKWLEDRIRYPFFRANEPIPLDASLRINSYYQAEALLRKALYSGEIKAYFTSAKSETAGELMHVLAEGWSTDAGQEILWHGRADLIGEPAGRIVFVDGFALRMHFFGEVDIQNGPAAPPRHGETVRVATIKLRGRPSSWDWPTARQNALKLLDFHGLPNPDDPAFPNKAALERKTAEFLTTKDRSPAESDVRKHVTRWLDEYVAGARPENEAGN